jgi:8-oxo-dGTP pyrophosphatase MutT (NUDIX family)
MAEKAKFTVGVFAGIIRPDGKLLLRRRVEEDSIIPGQSFKGNYELPGGGVMEQEGQVSYALLAHEVMREVAEEVGLRIDVNLTADFYALPFKGPNGYDLTLVTPVLIDYYPDDIVGEHLWVTSGELNQLAHDFVAAKKDPYVEGKGLVSGYGKRMHCLSLTALLWGPNSNYGDQAQQTLIEIQKSW